MYTITIIVSLIAIGLLLYHFRNAGPVATDKIVADLTAHVKTLEANAVAKAKEITHYDELKTAAETEFNKAKDIAEKLKGVVS